MTDFRWQDLGDARMKVGIFGADTFMKIYGSTDLAIFKDANQVLVLPCYRKDQAENIYSLAQAQKQSLSEKRRIRELEELMTKSGRVTIGTNPVPQQIGIGSEDTFTKLEQARQILEKKLITDSEYESIWYMMHKLRITMGFRDSQYKLDKIVELDEGFFESDDTEKDEDEKAASKKRGRGSQR